MSNENLAMVREGDDETPFVVDLTGQSLGGNVSDAVLEGRYALKIMQAFYRKQKDGKGGVNLHYVARVQTEGSEFNKKIVTDHPVPMGTVTTPENRKYGGFLSSLVLAVAASKKGAAEAAKLTGPAQSTPKSMVGVTIYAYIKEETTPKGARVGKIGYYIDEDSYKAEPGPTAGATKAAVGAKIEAAIAKVEGGNGSAKAQEAPAPVPVEGTMPPNPAESILSL